MDIKSKRLVGIKAIAHYLNTSDRNVYRWEKELGLPLKRVAGFKGRTVYVDIEDLENWLKSKDFSKLFEEKPLYKKTPRRKNLLYFTLISIATVSLFIILMRVYQNINPLKLGSEREVLTPFTCSFEANAVYIKDNEGKNIWSFIANGPSIGFNPISTNKAIDFLDIDDDGANEVIARTYTLDEDKYYTTLFDNDGKVLWKRYISNEQKFNRIKLESSFFPLRIVSSHSHEGDEYIVTYWRHRTRFLSIISCYTYEGLLVNKYINVGHLSSLETLDLDGDGNKEIIFFGTNNLLNGEGILGVLPSIDFQGVSPPYCIESEYKHLAYHLEKYVADNPKHGNQLIYLRFKRTNQLDKYQSTHIMVNLENIDSNLIHVGVRPWILEQSIQSFGLMYVFDYEFNIMDVFADALMLKSFPLLQKNKEIDITLDELLDIYSKNVLRWDDGSWLRIYKSLPGSTK